MADETVSIPKEQAIRMLKLFGDIEHLLDENKTIHPDAEASDSGGCDDYDEGSFKEPSIHQRVSWMTSGYGCFIMDNTDWKI